MYIVKNPLALFLRIILLAGMSGALFEAGAQVAINSVGSVYFQDFNSLASTGSSNTVPTGWAFVETGSSADGNYTAGTGISGTGNTYSFGASSSTERAFGGLRSPSLVPTLGASFINNTGEVIGSLTIVYKGEQWRLGALGREDRLDFQYSTTATALTTGIYTNFNSLDFIAPVQGPTIGALNGDVAPNFTVESDVITGLSIPNGATFWIRWLDFDPAGNDDGLAIDSFSLYACPLVSCPADSSVCIVSSPFALTGGSPTGGTYTGTGVTNGIFDPNAAGLGSHTITYTYSDGPCSGNCNFEMVVTDGSAPVAGTYGPVCVMDPNVQLMGMPPGGTWTGLGVVPGNMFDPNAGTQTLTYTLSNGCVSSDQTTITVNPCLMPPEMRWVLLDNMGESHGTCVSQTDCYNNIICFGLQYTPNVTGTMSSYTTGWTIDCYNNGTNPVLSNSSCVLSNNSFFQDGCAEVNQVQWNFLGATPGAPVVTQGVPLIVHQVCFVIPNSGSVDINDFPPGSALTTSIDISSTNHTYEEPTYIPFSFDSSLYCGLLPVRYLLFNADKFDYLVSKLDWATAEELNNDHFEVQRSNDIDGNFETIGRVEAALHPRSVNPYQFFDHAAHPGTNFYRLKQFDRDGRFTFSPIKTVNFTTLHFEVKAWPNPVNETLNVYISHADDPGKLRLIDLAGRVIKQQDVAKGDSACEIDVSRLARGMYTLIVIAGAEYHTEKIIISD